MQADLISMVNSRYRRAPLPHHTVTTSLQPPVKAARLEGRARILSNRRTAHGRACIRPALVVHTQPRIWLQVRYLARGSRWERGTRCNSARDVPQCGGADICAIQKSHDLVPVFLYTGLLQSNGSKEGNPSLAYRFCSGSKRCAPRTCQDQPFTVGPDGAKGAARGSLQWDRPPWWPGPKGPPLAWPLRGGSTRGNTPIPCRIPAYGTQCFLSRANRPAQCITARYAGLIMASLALRKPRYKGVSYSYFERSRRTRKTRKDLLP